jgi:hypothetical protein
MTTEFVIAASDINCHWDGLTPPIYRCYVNDELFAERTWIWTDMYLEECLQIQAEPGKYYIRYELINSSTAELSATNLRIEQGPAVISPDGAVHIYLAKR